MPFFDLAPDKISFPPGHFADVDGLLAIGGDTTAEWLLKAYEGGIFQWSTPMELLHWWSPNPRIVLLAENLEYHGDLNPANDDTLSTTFNQDLNAIMKAIEKMNNKPPMDRKWITGSFIKAYKDLAKIADVQSCEIWKEGELIAGVFGTVINKVFFGEYVHGINEDVKCSVLIALVESLSKKGVVLFDLTKETMETGDIGYTEIPRSEFFIFLK